MRYGTAKPGQLVERAAAWNQPALALTDRDGLYGAVKFVRACMEHGIAPILGVDLALEPPTREGARPTRQVRTPVRGGALVDPRLPRVTVLARGSGGPVGLAPGEGWAALCRLVTATHLRGERGNPVTTADLIATHAGTRQDLEHHATHLIVHGLLHLAGHDHEISTADAEAMEALETKALAICGIADPYGDRAI